MMYWLFKWLLATLSTLLVAAVLLLMSSYLLLRSPLFYHTLLPQLQPILQQNGLRIEQLESLEIDLLRGIKLSGLRLHWQNSEHGWASLQLGEFELRYSLSELRQQRLFIETLALKNMDLEAELSLPSQPKKQTEEPLDWQQKIREQVLPLAVKNLSVEQSQIKVTLLKSEETLRIETGLDYQGELQWQVGEINSQQRIELSALNLIRRHNNEQQTLSKADLSLQLGLNLLDLGHEPQLNFNSKLEFNADKLLHNTSMLQLALQPQGQLSFSGNLSQLNKPLESLYLEFEQRFLIERFELTQHKESGKVETIRLAKQQAVFSGEYKKGHIQLHSELVQQQLQLPQLKQAVNTKQVVHLSSDVALIKPQLGIQLFLQEQPLLSLNIKAENKKNNVILKSKMVLYARQNLLAYSDLAKPLNKFGGQKIELQAEVKLQHQQQNIQSIDLNNLMQWPAIVAGKMSLTQLSQPKQKGSPIYKQPIKVNFSVKKEARYQVEWQLKAPQLKLAELKRPLALEWQNSSEFQWPLQQSSITGSVSLDHTPALTYQAQLDDREKEANISAILDLMLDPKWQRYHASLAQLDQLGRSDLNWNLQATVQHRKPSLLSVLAEDLPQSQIQLQSHLKVKQRSRGKLLQFKQPLELKQQLNWSGRGLELANQFKAGHLQVNNLFKTNHLQAELGLVADGLPAPKKAQLTFSADAESLIVKQDFETAALLFPLSLKATGRQTGQQLELDEFKLDLSKKLLQLELSANFNPQNNSGQASGLLQSRLRPNVLQQPALSGGGSVALPWQLTLEEGKRASLEAEMIFTDFSLSLDQMALNNINGSLKIAEEVQLNDDNSVGFRYLLHVDPFQRVDYSRVQPQLLSRQNLSIERVQLDRYQAGPLHASLGLEQNLLKLQQFDLALYGGFITGQFYLDATPGNWKIGLLSRLSHINLQPLLAEDSAYKNSAQQPISARTALEFDLKRRLLEGRIDISDISREQLLQLLELFDPHYEDEQLAKIRAAVQISYPEWLALKMQKGLLDLELSLSLIPGTLRVQNLPLSPILERFSGEALNKIEALPLQ